MISVVVPRELKFPYQNNVITCPPDKIANIENNSQFSNLSNPDKQKENAASATTDNDVLFESNAAKHSTHYSTNRPTKTSIPASVNAISKTFFWNTASNSAELLEHWVSSRGHRFGYDLEVLE